MSEHGVTGTLVPYDGGPYLTVSESIRQNGDRHKANGFRYLTEGKPSYAAGSFRKAERNYRLADLLA